MKKALIFLSVCAVVLFSQAIAEDYDGGYTGEFLEVGLSARAVGMGQAQYAVSDDATGMFYNPAGTAYIKERGVGFSYRVMDLDRKMSYASVNFPVRGEATLSVGWIYKGVGDVIERDRLGEPGDELKACENVLSVSFSRIFSKYISIGATAKYHIAELANVNSTTAGFDIGALFRLDKSEETLPDESFFDLLRFGALVGNLGASHIWTTGDYWQKWGEAGDSQTDDFPVLIGGGVSALVMDSTLLVAVDVRKYQWKSLRIQAGGEYALGEILKLRAGLDDFHPTFGGGIEKKFENYTLKIDYGFSSPRDEEKSDHIFTVGFIF